MKDKLIQDFKSCVSFRDKFDFFRKMDKDLLINSIWVNNKSGRKVTLVSIMSLSVVIQHENGKKTTKGDHYFVGDYTLESFKVSEETNA